MMRVIVMGGAGDMGSKAVEDLALSEGIAHVTIADRNIEGAKAIAARLAGKGASVDVKAVDANNHGELVAAMKGHDVAASALGPFHRFESKLVRAAVEAGVHYASICDEWDAAQAVFDQYDEPAKKAGVTVVTCLGASPGATSIGFRLLHDEFDAVKCVDVYCYQPLDAGGGAAVIQHMLYIMTGEIAVWRGGKRIMVKALSEQRTIEFPKYGRIKLWNMGHAEPMTIPRFFPKIEEVNFFMGYGTAAEAIVYPAKWGFFTTPSRVDMGTKVLLAVEKLTHKPEPAWGSLRIDVQGIKDGRPAQRTLCGIGQMREVTGLSLSIGTQMLAKGQLTVSGGGVYAPEACFDPKVAVAAFKAKGIQVFEDVGITRPF